MYIHVVKRNSIIIIICIMNQYLLNVSNIFNINRIGTYNMYKETIFRY